MSDDHDTKALVALYEAPPLPPAFQETLLQQASLTAAPGRSRRVWWMSAGLAAAAAIGIAAFAWSTGNRPPTGQQSSTDKKDPLRAPDQAAIAEGQENLVHAPPPVPPSATGQGTGGARLESERVLQASAIVRATLDGIKGDTVTYTVTRVIYGQADLGELQEEVPGPKQWLVPQVGREVLLYLRPRSGAPGSGYLIASARYATSDRPLDESERQIVEILRNARLIDAAQGPAPLPNQMQQGEAQAGVRPLATQVADASLILRVRVEGWNDQVVKYSVVRVINGKWDQPTIELDPFGGSARVRTSELGRARAAFQQSQGRAPSGEELLQSALAGRAIEKGRERIVMLSMASNPDGTASFRESFSANDRSPNTLPDLERQIQDILRARNAPLAAAPPPSRNASGRMGLLSLTQQVARAPLIVRVRMGDRTDHVITCTLVQTIYGRTTETNFQWTWPGDTFYQKDREAILQLLPMASGGDVKGEKGSLYRRQGGSFDVPMTGGSYRSFQEYQAALIDVIRQGDYLEPSMAENFRQLVQDAGAIVRVKLAAANEKEATWTVLKGLKGPLGGAAVVPTERLIVDHYLFDLRAEALVNDAARSDAALKDPAAREARVAAESRAMREKELEVGKEAVLFLTSVKVEGATAHGVVTGRVYEGSPRITLDVLEDTVLGRRSVPGAGNM